VAKTRTGMMMGTPAYLSPEQARGTNVSYPTDIYALGCMIYEICTGRLPFVAQSAMDIVLMHIEEPVRPPSELWAAMPRRLELLVLRMLEKDPARRPSLAEVRNVFTELILTGEVVIDASSTYRSDLRTRGNTPVPVPVPGPIHPIVANPPGPTPSVKPRSRAPLWLAIAALAIAATVIAVLLATRTQPVAVAAPVIDAAIPRDAAVVAIAIDAAQPGTIAIRADADDATIQVDGVMIPSDHGSARIPQSAGSHHVVIGAPDRGEYDTTVQVVGNATVTLDVRLEHVRKSTPALPKPPTPKPKPRPHTPAGSGSATSGDSTIDPFADH
jgi:serine/threonine protein kinase